MTGEWPPCPVFGRPVGFPSATDAPVVSDLGSPPSVSDALGMEPEVRVDVEEALDDPNVLIVGPVEHVSPICLTLRIPLGHGPWRLLWLMRLPLFLSTSRQHSW